MHGHEQARRERRQSDLPDDMDQPGNCARRVAALVPRLQVRSDQVADRSGSERRQQARQDQRRDRHLATPAASV
jgi:hypothetical protein